MEPFGLKKIMVDNRISKVNDLSNVGIGISFYQSSLFNRCVDIKDTDSIMNGNSLYKRCIN